MFARVDAYRPEMVYQPTVKFSRTAVPAWMQLAATKVAMMIGHFVMAFREARQMQRALRKTRPFGVDH